jgi:hypothetical protein
MVLVVVVLVLKVKLFLEIREVEEQVVMVEYQLSKVLLFITLLVVVLEHILANLLEMVDKEAAAVVEPTAVALLELAVAAEESLELLVQTPQEELEETTLVLGEVVVDGHQETQEVLAVQELLL